jgi:TolB-like protein/Flp pilus assembly protein TadD/DNA-binding winged helix-turn-helix (wHTH) protein
MDAGDLDSGFRLGDWVVEPREGRISGNGQSHRLTFHQIRILQILAERHGEVVDRQYLRDNAWPCQHTTDDMLRTAIRELRQVLGDSPQDPRYIVRIAQRGFALIAHFEPFARPDRAQAAIDPGAVVVNSTLAARAQRFVVELRRRSVLKVLSAYLVGMFVVLQVAQTTFAPLHFPEWWMTALTILAAIGIPIVGVLAWSYEITPGGIVLDSGDTATLKLPRARRAMAPALVTGVALMAGVTGLAWWRSIADAGKPALSAAEPAPRSIAVLPLVDLTQGGGNAYLGDGFSEEISAQLAQVPGLRVAARTSAFEFKDKRLDVRKIGQALGVHNVLEGSVRRDGDKLRVTVQLIDASNGYHLWAGSWDRKWEDVIAIQDEIARQITRALEVVLTPEAERKLRRGDVENLAAYDSYLAGVSALHKSADLSRLNQAADLFHRALELDPEFSRAYAGLCEVGIKRYDRTSATADVTEAETACRKALQLDPSRDETEMALATLYLASGRHEQAEAVYRGLLARRPQDADVYVGLGRALEGQNQREEAERSFRKAVEVEPSYWQTYTALGNFLFNSGRAEEAIAPYQKAAELVPRSASAYNNVGGALLFAGRVNEAAAAYEKSLALEPSRSAHANLGSLYYYQGRFPEAVRQYESAEAIASSDHLVIGGLADALWFIPGRRPEAVVLYQRAAKLAEESLKVNPSDALVWAQLGYYSGRAGDPQSAAHAQARAEALGERDMYVHYYIAQAAADRHDIAASRAAMEKAEKLGYPRKLLEVDPLLKSLLPSRKKA